MKSSVQKTTVIGQTPSLEINKQAETNSLELTEHSHLLGRDRTEGADLTAPPDCNVICHLHAVLHRHGEDCIIHDRDSKQKTSSKGLFFHPTPIPLTHGYRLRDNTELEIGQTPDGTIRLKYCNPIDPQSSLPAPGKRSISLRNQSILIGRDPNANLQLNAPIVSRRHATIETDRRGNYILQDVSTNGVFVNGHKVKGSMQLPWGAIVRIDPYTLHLQGDRLTIVDFGEQIRLDAVKIPQTVKRKKDSKTLLNDITVPIEPGQFVALGFRCPDRKPQP